MQTLPSVLISLLSAIGKMAEKKPMDAYEAARIYSGLSPRKRLFVSLGLVAFSAFGIWGSSKLEEMMPVQPKIAKMENEWKEKHKDIIAKELE